MTPMSPSDTPTVNKLILVPGSSLHPPTAAPPGSKVTFHFRTCLKDAPPDSSIVSPPSWPAGQYSEARAIDDSKSNNVPMELLLGKQFKLPILEQCVTSMRINEVSQFILPKALVTPYPFVSQAYRKHVKSVKRKRDLSRGKFDDEDEAPSHRCCGMNITTATGHSDLDSLIDNPSDLVFLIELLSVEHTDAYEKELWQMTDEEKNLAIPQLKEQGNDLCKSGEYLKAEKKYGKALAIIDHLQMKEKPGEEEWHQFDKLKIPILANFALCKLHLEQYYDVIRHTTTVIELDSKNVKCYFRRAKAHIEVWNLDEARKDLKRAAELDESLTSTVQKELKRIDSLELEKRKEEASRLSGKLFR